MVRVAPSIKVFNLRGTCMGETSIAKQLAGLAALVEALERLYDAVSSGSVDVEGLRNGVAVNGLIVRLVETGRGPALLVERRSGAVLVVHAGLWARVGEAARRVLEATANR